MRNDAMTRAELRAALEEEVRRRGGDPSDREQLGAVVGLTAPAIGNYLYGARNISRTVLLRLRIAQLEREVADLRAELARVVGPAA